MIGQIQRVRPKFGNKDLLLHNHTGELSYLPEEFAPHTILASVVACNTCEYVFEYQIDEDPDTSKTVSMGINLTLGKYTAKVLKITVQFNSVQDLIGKMAIVSNSLNLKKAMLNKESYKRNYDLVINILGDLEMDLVNNKQVRQLIENAC